MIILVHENHDNLPIVTQMHHFVVVSTTQISQVLSVVPNIYQKIDLLMCCFFSEYEYLKRVILKDGNVFPYKRKIGNRAHFAK